MLNTVYMGKVYPNQLMLLDFASQTVEANVNAGVISGTDLEIISHSNRILKFKINKTISAGQNWSGTITIIKFNAKTTGQTSIEFKQ